MSRVPLNLQTARPVLVTSAVVGTYVSDTVLPAPGAGFRYRVREINLSLENTAQNARVFGGWQSGAVVFGDLNAGWGGGNGPILFPGGRAAPVNTAVTCQHQSDLAGVRVRAFVAYTIEPV